ncbi:MFS transporter [Roseibaca sp. Y0-43]|nr:MFS transporter [Roseibaca sp. Y0-43]MCC1482383.1 MFS transporter [Roseibaca sp. Y0-43]
MLAMAGLPIYIHAPFYYVEEYAVSLAALGTVLFVLRGLDFLQDPALGWLAARLGAWRGQATALAVLLLSGAMVMLFAVTPQFWPLAWFAIAITVLFTCYSFLTICFYATGAARGATLGQGGHVRLAAWRESGALVGVCLAAAAPVALEGVLPAPFTGFALGFLLVALVAGFAMRAEWPRFRPDMSAAGPTMRDVLSDPTARRLLTIALVNATPVAITSTLFLFYAESVLQTDGAEGPLLILLFLAAAASAPGWAWLAKRMGAKLALLLGMALAAGSFAFVLTLGPGQVIAFAIICVISGAGMGADLTLLPAIFSRRMAELSPEAAQGFGLWAFVTKATLALAALIVFPTLDMAGFEQGAENSDTALSALILLYAAVPTALKACAFALLALTPLKES